MLHLEKELVVLAGLMQQAQKVRTTSVLSSSRRGPWRAELKLFETITGHLSGVYTRASNFKQKGSFANFVGVLIYSSNQKNG